MLQKLQFFTKQLLLLFIFRVSKMNESKDFSNVNFLNFDVDPLDNAYQSEMLLKALQSNYIEFLIYHQEQQHVRESYMCLHYIEGAYNSSSECYDMSLLGRKTVEINMCDSDRNV